MIENKEVIKNVVYLNARMISINQIIESYVEHRLIDSNDSARILKYLYYIESLGFDAEENFGSVERLKQIDSQLYWIEKLFKEEFNV